MYVRSPDDVEFKTVKVTTPGTILSILILILFDVLLLPYSFVLISGPLGEEYAWYQCTVSSFPMLILIVLFGHVARRLISAFKLSS